MLSLIKTYRIDWGPTLAMFVSDSSLSSPVCATAEMGNIDGTRRSVTSGKPP